MYIFLTYILASITTFFTTDMYFKSKKGKSSIQASLFLSAFWFIIPFGQIVFFVRKKIFRKS